MSEETSLNSEQGASSKKMGCLKVAGAVCLFGFTAVLVALFIIDRLNIGRQMQADVMEKLSFLGKTKTETIIKTEVVKEVVEVEVEVPVEKIVKEIVEVEVKPPMPSSYIPWQKIDTAKLWNGIRIANSVEGIPGSLASQERTQGEAIQIEMKLTYRVPQPSRSMGELAALNSDLPAMLAGLVPLVERSTVSPFYFNLYERKIERLQQHATRLDKLLSVHNYMDTETVLELENPATNQLALLIQSDMDVVSDGSDGDRWPFLDNYISMSQYYQPFTSYGWPKRTGTPNPLLKRMAEELAAKKARFAVKGLSIAENRELRERIEQLTKMVEDISARSYLIAEADPFIVMSLSFLGRTNQTKFAPMIGDYAVVVHKDKLYPAIIGDAGPTFKFGEASLRLAKEINPKASPYNRPVSDLSVTYLVFPGSREKVNTPPDYDVWHDKCQQHLDQLGGIGAGYQLHRWENIIPKKLAQWKAQNPGAVIATQPSVQPTIVDPATLPQPSFSAPVTPVAPPKEAVDTTGEGL